MRAVDSNGQYSKIDKNTILTGTINAKTDIRIDGTLDGDVITTGKVIIGKDAQVKGKLFCGNADIEGIFNGELTVSGILNLIELIHGSLAITCDSPKFLQNSMKS